MRHGLKVWISAIVGAAISGAAGGLINAALNLGISPEAFNFQGGTHLLLKTLLTAIAANAGVGVAMYLKKSPLPEEEPELALPDEKKRGAA